MSKCAHCRRDVPDTNLKACVYCGKRFCSECYDKHMSWELRHKGLAEDASKLWRRKRRNV